MGLLWYGTVLTWDCFGLGLFWFGTVSVGLFRWDCFGLGLFHTVAMVFNKKKCLKSISINLVTLSIPKVAKNGQKVPILAISEI